MRRRENEEEREWNGENEGTGLKALLYELLDRVAPYPVHGPLILSVGS